MNQLSWLLYLGNVAGNVGGLLTAIGLMALVWGVIQVFLYWDTLAALRYHPEMAEKLKPGRRVLSVWLTGLLAAVLWMAAAMCPSQNTVYAIAASQMGEQALKTPMVGKASQALEAWLDKQIKDNSKASE